MSSYASFSHTLLCAPTSISINRDGSQCAVAGRNLFKIFSMEEKRFVEKANLVFGPKTLKYSISDVQWHPLEENYLATAAGNGVVIIWDLNKVNEQKQDFIFSHHDRFVNKICFHPSEAALLLSCDQDGTMNIFDIRKKGAVITFQGKTGSIRSVQFHPTQRDSFAAACESGNVQLWDMKKPDHYNNQFTAHTGPVYTLHWHPEDRFWLATGGRDKAIKVWDIQSRGQPIHNIQTIESVANIQWRPKEKFHIASCALILDNNVNIWDIRRPYVPFAAFEAHKNVATDIVWRHDPDVMLSCSKDRTIRQHIMSEADRPASKAPPVAHSLSANGRICYAFANTSTKNVQKASGLKPVTPIQSPAFFKKPPSSQSDFYLASSSMNMGRIGEILDEHLIEALAQKYLFYGKSFPELCDHNSQVSDAMGLHDKAQTWEILKLLYINDSQDSLHGDLCLPMPRKSSFGSQSNQQQNDGCQNISDTGDNEHEPSTSSEEDSTDDTPREFIRSNFSQLSLAGPAELDAVFGDAQFNNQLSADMHADETQDWNLPTEAIQLRHSIAEKTGQSEKEDVIDEEVEEESNGEKNGRQTPFTPKGFFLELFEWSFAGLVKDTLFFYAEQGDIQMSVTILLLLGERSKSMIDPVTVEAWFLEYIDILYRLQLWNIATNVIRHSIAPGIRSMNQNSTIINILCGNCNKNIPPDCPPSYCSSCQKIVQICSICHIPVKGLYSWCQGCGHGGHLMHLKNWFASKKYCPAGCGHKCEYS